MKYVACKINNKTIKLYRFILDISDSSIIIDHSNRNSLDCRKKNLEITSYSRNNLNSSFSKNNTSGRTGVYYVSPCKTSPKGAYRDQVQVNGKKKGKSFSINKYGKKKAKKLSIKQREEWERIYDIKTERFNDYRN